MQNPSEISPCSWLCTRLSRWLLLSFPGKQPTASPGLEECMFDMPVLLWPHRWAPWAGHLPWGWGHLGGQERDKRTVKECPQWVPSSHACSLPVLAFHLTVWD